MAEEFCEDPSSRLTYMSRFASRVLEWYGSNARKLPWRGLSDPYAVWVSEIMLQQTRVDAVIPYFKRWMHRFPTVRSLAAASERDVLRVWEGLGYYTRARNLHAAARIVQMQLAGKLPTQDQALRRLPGIGRYTAGAIASIAFGSDVPALDGNIRRVLARAFNVSERANTTTGETILWEIAGKHLPRGRAAAYNQAIMDIGATICLPKHPECRRCPLAGLCRARKLGIQEQLPVRLPRRALPHQLLAAAVVKRGGRILLTQRASSGLLGGLWAFPNAAIRAAPIRTASSKKRVSAALEQAYGLKFRLREHIGTIQRVYSHFRVSVYTYACDVITRSPKENLRWIRIRDLARYPMGRVDRQIARQL